MTVFLSRTRLTNYLLIIKNSNDIIILFQAPSINSFKITNMSSKKIFVIIILFYYYYYF